MTLDANTFRETLSRFASGVTVVTTLHNDERQGVTVSAFASVSAEPPQILVCLNARLYAHELIKESGRFAVNILAAHQQEFGMRFAGMIPDLEDRFEGITCATAQTGSPILPGTLGWLDCEVRQTHDGGTHTIFIGEVVASGVNEATEPLLYFNRNWRNLADLPPQDEAVE